MTTLARDIMSSELLVAKPDMTVEEALKILINNRITGMPVVNDEGRMIGVVSEYDIIKQMGHTRQIRRELFLKPIEYTHDSDSIPDKMPLADILERFVNSKYRRLPVVDPKGKLIGIITRRDLMRVFYYRAQLA